MPNSKETSDLFEIGIIRASEAKETTEFLVKHFFPNEPICRGFGLPTSQVTRWFPSQIEECLKPEISVSAKEKLTGKLVGVAINIIVEKTLNASNKDGAQKEGRGLLEILDPQKESVMVQIAKFLALLNQVPDCVYGEDAALQPQPIKTFNCVYLAVDPMYGGKGIGGKLVTDSIRIAEEKGISQLQVDTTSELSYRIFNKKCGYEVVREIDLQPYIPGITTVDNGLHKKGRILLKKI